MPKIISTLALIIALILFPPTGLILISQNAVKGEALYPVKRTLEGGILYIVALNPYTRAYFAVALANRRYDEIILLLGNDENADSTLQELVVQAGTAASDINKVSSAYQRSQLIADLSTSIDKYQKGLTDAQDQLDKRSEIIASQNKPQASQVTQSPSIEPQASSTFSTAQPSPQLTQPVRKSNLTEEERRRREAIEKAKRELEELKRKLEEEKKKLLLQSINSQTDSQPQPSPTPSSSPTSRPSPSPSPSPILSPSPRPSASARSAVSISLEKREQEKNKKPSPSPSSNH
jgi:hypothetical protein